MLLGLLLACQSDVSIIKRLEEEETGQAIGVGEPGEPAAIPSSEPAWEQERAGVTGLSTMYLNKLLALLVWARHKN